MFSKFDNFWHKDGQDDEIMQRALIFTFTFDKFSTTPVL